MYHLKISEDTVCELFIHCLVQDYKHNEENLAEMKRIKAEWGKLENYQKEDYKSYKRQRKALKMMLDMYTVDGGKAALEASV